MRLKTTGSVSRIKDSADLRSGLGAEEVEDAIRSHHDHHHPPSAPTLGLTSDANMGLESSTTNAGDSTLASLKDSVWARLEQHPDITVKKPDATDASRENAEKAPGESSSSSSRTWVFASEERIWQALTGHGINYALIPSKLFEILEVVAAAGPDGILQPEARRLTGQDKQSIPIRTDKLADRGYITKEKVSVPKMITSRLRFWRFGDETQSDSKDPFREIGAEDGAFNHDECFDTIARMLRENGGIAVLRDVQLETDCTSYLRRKGLARCIDRLLGTGMLRKVKAKVHGEYDISGSDRMARCIQLLREPTDKDRQALMRKGGPVKLDEQGRPIAASRLNRYSGPKRQHGGGPPRDVSTAATSQSRPASVGRPRREASHQVDASSPVGSLEPRKAAEAQGHSGVGPPDGSVDPSGTAQPPQPVPRESEATYQPNSSNEIHNGPGVFFAAPRREKGKIGRPKKSLVAVFKSNKLRDPERFAELNYAHTATTLPHQSNAQASGPSQEMQSSPAVSSPVSMPNGAPTTAPPTPNTIFIDERVGPNGVQPDKPLSNHALGQRRRRERERALKAATAAAAITTSPKGPETMSDRPDDGNSVQGSASTPNDSESSQAPELAQQLLRSFQKPREAGTGSTAFAEPERATPDVAGSHSQANGVLRQADEMRGHQHQHHQDPILEDTAGSQNRAGSHSSRVDGPNRSSNTDNELIDSTSATETIEPDGLNAVDSSKSRDSTRNDQALRTQAASSSRTTDVPAIDQPWRDPTNLPEPRFVPFVDEDGSCGLTPKMRAITNHGPAHLERCNVVMDIVKTANGVFPGHREMFFPFVTKWKQAHDDTPGVRTIMNVIETLRMDGSLEKYEFSWPRDGAGGDAFFILMEPGIGPSSERVKEVQSRMIEVWPEAYMPGEVEVTDKLRREGGLHSISFPKKRANDADSQNSPRKRRKVLDAQDSDDDYVDDDDDNDEDHEIAASGNDGDWRYNFPVLPGVTVKRTKAGLEDSIAEARRNGFTDPVARVQANVQLGRASYIHLRNDALREGHVISADEIRPMTRDSHFEEDYSEQAPVTETPKRRVGRPKGSKTKNAQTSSVRNDVAFLGALLLCPNQVYHPPTGTFGTTGAAPIPAGFQGRALSKTTASDANGRRISKKRSADEMNEGLGHASSLLMRSKQTLHGPSGTFGTDAIVNVAPQANTTGRGKRIKKSTEKAVPISDPHWMANEFLPNAGTRTTPSSKAPAYSKSKLYDDPEGTVSTEYVNRHPEETWYHRGRGRWARGLPPPTASYKTAVKGPGAAAYLAQKGTREGKPKQHGEVVDGQQMKRNGEPWKIQPNTVNGVRVNPIDDERASPSQSIASLRAPAFNAAPTVQYEIPTPRPAFNQDASGYPALGLPQLQPWAPNFFQPTLTPTSPVPGPNTAEALERGIFTGPQPFTPLATPPPTQPEKRKRPYTYKSRKQLSTVGPDGVPIELDRASDDDYAQSSTRKRRKRIQTDPNAAKSKHPIDREKLSTAVALVRNLSPAATYKQIRWDLVALALEMDDRGAAAETQYRSIVNHHMNAKFVTAMQEAMQEPFLTALEAGELPPFNLVDLAEADWPDLLRWAEENVVPLVDEQTTQQAKKTIEAAPVQKIKQGGRSGVGPAATYSTEPKDLLSALDLAEDMITAKSWIRANSATTDKVYDTAKATEKLAQLGTSILQAVDEMQKTSTIRQLKKGRQRPGRNFDITQHVWNQFSRWPGDGDDLIYLQSLADARDKVVQHFTDNDTLEMVSDMPEQDLLILNSMLAQGTLKMDVRLPPRNDDVDAPNPKLNAWSYGGPRHDTRKIERTAFDFPAVYTKTSAFSSEHGLQADVPIPSFPQPLPNELLPRVPFWIDIHGDLIPHIWEKVLSSIIYLLVRKPGITAKGIEKAHGCKLWAWEIELALEWMAKVGVAERFGGGKEVDGAWKGGWTAGEEWHCVFAPEIATWR